MSEVTEPKRLKISTPEAVEDKRNGYDPTNDLHRFNVKRVLNHLRERHCIFLEAEEKETNIKAIIKLEKTPFKEDVDLLNRICSVEAKSTVNFNNDIYSTLELTPCSDSLISDICPLKTSLIYPATDKHIIKYLSQEVFFVEETGKDYLSITLPFLESEQFSTQWIYNILDHKKETDRIVFEDPDEENGFILLPDMKWDGQQLTDLYLSAIVRRRDIKSIRDLRQDHLPLLYNILNKGTSEIAKKYNIPRSQLVMYFHYQPSYYHLHVHFTHVSYEAPGRCVSGAHVLQTVIDCIERNGDHFSKCTLPFKVRQNDGLFRKYHEAGKL